MIVVDIDNEFNYYKFGNDMMVVFDWIVDFFVEMNVMYECDLLLYLQFGDIFLCFDSGDFVFDDDFYDINSVGVSSVYFDEFGDYWQVNMGGVDCVFVVLFFGKFGSNYSSLGIVWFDGYCEVQSLGGGYSVIQIFKVNINVFYDVKIVGYEIGYNFGLLYMYCYLLLVDQCFNQEGSCYSGVMFCLVLGVGMLMSYCYLFFGCGLIVDIYLMVVDWFDMYLQVYEGLLCVVLYVILLIFKDDFELLMFGFWSQF